MALTPAAAGHVLPGDRRCNRPGLLDDTAADDPHPRCRDRRPAQREQLNYTGFLAELLLAECDDRDRRRSERGIKAARFPREYWLADLEYSANPNIEPALIAALSTCEWVRRGEPLCLIGDSGTGKSHRLIGLGAHAAQKGYRVEYVLATKLVNELVEAADERQLSRTISR